MSKWWPLHSLQSEELSHSFITHSTNIYEKILCIRQSLSISSMKAMDIYKLISYKTKLLRNVLGICVVFYKTDILSCKFYIQTEWDWLETFIISVRQLPVMQWMFCQFPQNFSFSSRWQTKIISFFLLKWICAHYKIFKLLKIKNKNEHYPQF